MATTAIAHLRREPVAGARVGNRYAFRLSGVQRPTYYRDVTRCQRWASAGGDVNQRATAALSLPLATTMQYQRGKS